MNPERWRQLSGIYQLALEREPGERAAYLEEACAGDAELLEQLRSLLAAHDEAGVFFEAPAVEFAAPMLLDDRDRLERGGRVGPYLVLDHLGSGGMGEVYLMKDTRLGRKVALKVLPPHFSANPERVLRFRSEARAASALSHPNILTVYEVGEFEGRHFIATEFIDGVTLRQRMKGPPMRIGEALDVAIQVARALARSHRGGIIHRDIKPENIMIDTEGLVKVLDFGLAKQTAAAFEAGTASRTHASTNPGVVMGTVAYMSPEQARGQEVDARTDVWSLGVVLYEMAAGRTPFGGPTPNHVLVSLLDEEPRPLEAYAAGVPPGLEGIVGKALFKNREMRYGEVGEMLADLEELRRRLEAEGALDRPLQVDGAAARGRVTDGVAPRSHAAARADGAIAPADAGWRVGLPAGKACAALALAAVIAAAALLAARRPDGGSDSIAVLPFSYENGDPTAASDPEREYLADGIAEGIISDLSQLPGLRVIARSSVFRYKGREADPQAVGRELGVRTVLAGSIAQHGDRLTVAAELVEASSRGRLWGRRFEVEATELAAVQREIVRATSRSLNLRLAGADERRVGRSKGENPEAYRLYLLGRYHWNKRTEEGFRRAIEFFNSAVEQDPSYAPAYVGLADAYQLLANYSLLDSHEAYARARAAALKALELDDGLGEAHASLGKIAMDYDWDWDGAEREFRRAVELNPSYAPGRQWYAGYLKAMQRFDEARQEDDRAQELDPLSLIINSSKGMTFFYERRYDEAIAQFRKPLDINPDFFLAHAYLGYAYGQQGRYDGAIAQYRKAIEMGGGFQYLGGVLGYTYAVAGRRDEALKVLSRLTELSKQRYVAPSDIAKIYIGLGDNDRAFEWLEKAYKGRSYGLQYIKVDPHYDAVRSDPRYAELLRRMGLAPGAAR